MSQVKVVYLFSPEDRNDIATAYLASVSLRVPGTSVIGLDDIDVGSDTAAAIDDLIESADVIVLFLSLNFRISPIYRNYEKKIWQKLTRNRAEVLLVYLRYHNLEGDPSPLYKLNFFPSKSEPIIKEETENRDRKWMDLSTEIEMAAEQRQALKDYGADQAFEKVANLCNRTMQRHQLNALKERRAGLEKRPKKLSPLICFIHGSPEENLDNYRDRLKTTEIKKVLSVSQIASYHDILWTNKAYNLKNIPKYLCEGLSKRLLNHSDAGKTEIGNKLGEHPFPVMISYRMGTAHWKKVKITDDTEKEPSQFIEEFLDFWNDIETEYSDIQVVVCLFFEYNETANYTEANTFAKRFFTRKKTADRATPEELADYKKFRLPSHWFPNDDELPAEEIEGEKKFENLCGIILDELPPVSLEDVNEWLIDGDAFRDICLQHSDKFCDADALLKQLEVYYEEAYEKRQIEELPMKELTGVLVEMLEEYTCKI
ncbi:MAG TPA: hypothetical protein VGC76_17200 [Pyrinomonadaceae bacterium]|jgi:hypothetical protein